MKKEFPILMKEMRSKLHPMLNQAILKSIEGNENECRAILDEIEFIQDQMLQEAEYSLTEFANLSKEYYLDFSDSNPDNWIIRYDPENAKVIHRML